MLLAMTKWTYDQEFAKMKRQLDALMDEREKLDKDRLILEERIKIVAKALASIGELARLDNLSDPIRATASQAMRQVVGDTVADKIRYVLREAAGPMTAREILARLAEFGFEFKDDRRPMATIHSVARRLVTAKSPLVYETHKDGRKAWAWGIPR
jgi:hypothetical protein